MRRGPWSESGVLLCGAAAWHGTLPKSHVERFWIVRFALILDLEHQIGALQRLCDGKFKVDPCAWRARSSNRLADRELVYHPAVVYGKLTAVGAAQQQLQQQQHAAATMSEQKHSPSQGVLGM